MESLAAWFQESFLPYGAWGILLLSALDSSFVPMPAFIDLAVMGAAGLSPQNAVGYAAGAVVGSTIGVMAVYGLARSGRRAARTEGPRIAWAEDFLRRRGALALLAAALMPAPFPFKAVVLAAGYLRQPVASMIIGVGGGRIIRFGLETWLVVRYGQQIIDTVQANGPLASLTLAALVIAAGVAFYRWQASLQPPGHPAATAAGPGPRGPGAPPGPRGREDHGDRGDDVGRRERGEAADPAAQVDDSPEIPES